VTKRVRQSTQISVTIKKKVTGKAPEEYHFVLKDGKRLGTVLELIDALEIMPEDMYKHHVKDTKNDFSTWLRDVFDEKHLAEDLRYVHHRFEAQRILMKHIMRKMLQEVKT
jgi:hypothetical protein